MKAEKHALLDTDFISKTHRIRKDEEHKLIDRILQLPDTVFYCHAQIRTEILRHQIPDASEWLEGQISNGKVRCYDDNRILLELTEIVGAAACTMYAQMLKTACESYSIGDFEKLFPCISTSDYYRIDTVSFLASLEQDCKALHTDQNLGELKSYVLLQFLNFMLGQQIYVFCSDDKNARNGIIQFDHVLCISVLSSFLRLKKESGIERIEAEPYIQSYLSFLQESHQTTFRIQNGAPASKIIKVPCTQVFEEIYAGKLEDLRNGNLKYI